MDRQGEQQPQELTTWKQVAEYLNVTVRTAQRWEKEKGLPVRRLGAGKSRLSADPAGLDAWKRSQELEAGPWWRRIRLVTVYAVVVTAALIGVVLWLHILQIARPSVWKVADNKLTVSSAQGALAWEVVFPQALKPVAYDAARGRRVWFEDIDKDGKIETLFAYHPVTRRVEGTALVCFSELGREKWRFVPGGRLQNRTSEIAGPYLIEDFHVVQVKGEPEKWILATSPHASQPVSQFAVLSVAGKLLAEYWHSGRLEQLEPRIDGGGRTEEILLGGVDGGRKLATLVALDPRRVGGTSEQATDDPLQIVGKGPGREKARVWFPDTCISERLGDRGRVSRVAATREETIVWVRPKAACQHCDLIYRLDRLYRVEQLDASEEFMELHAELAASGVLDHKLSKAEVARWRQVLVEMQ